MKKTTPPPPLKIVTKLVKHDFTPEERLNLGTELSQQIAKQRELEAEAKQVRDSYKARETELAAKVDRVSTSIISGFEMREKRCRVEYQTAIRKKFFYLEDAKNGADPVLVEDMTEDDFQQDLILAEEPFEHREEIELFPRANEDRGILVVGRFAGKWFSALRIKVGRQEINERLDSEQKCVKKRPDAVSTGIKRAGDWLTESLGKDHAKGFKERLDQIVTEHREREE